MIHVYVLIDTPGGRTMVFSRTFKADSFPEVLKKTMLAIQDNYAVGSEILEMRFTPITETKE